ncbi:MAG TPA: biotin/lipoyl-containing protein, partial [Planctomycetota bacterium]|nr:biotin/lipoyl-containing protein [Planctomycetota bacterium]
MATEVRLPNLGENIVSGDVVKLLVAVGDTIRAEQGLVELETDKAVIEVPSPIGGRVREIRVKQGEKVKVGAVIAIVDADGAPARAAEPPPSPPPPPKAVPEPVPAPTPVPLPRSSEGAPAAPSVRRFAREIGVDVSQVPGT